MTLYQILKAWNDLLPEDQQMEFTEADISAINEDTTDFSFNENNPQACSYHNHTYGGQYDYDFTFIADADDTTKFYGVPNIYEYEPGKFSIYFELWKLNDNYDSVAVTGTLYPLVNHDQELVRENFQDSTSYPRYTYPTVQYAGYNDRFNGYSARTVFTNFNIPLFFDRGKVVDYYRKGDDSGLLNVGTVKKKFEYFIKNTVYKDGRLLYYRDYRFVTNGYSDPHKMYLLKNNNGVGYDHLLKGDTNAVIIKKLQRQRSDSANEYSEVQSVEHEYLKNNQTTTNGGKYTVSFWRTNIYCFDDQNSADDYVASGDTSGATNTKDVNRVNNTIVDGHIGDVVSQTDNGSCKMTMVSGSKIYAVTSLALSAFFNNVLFNNDAVTQGKTVMEQVLDGTQMFGANQINAIGGCLYLPLDIDDIATTSSVTSATIGSYIATLNAKQVLKNDKMINCGTVFFEAPYGDWRDYECKLFVILPFCGIHELNISAYINSNVTLKYAVDVTSGACTAYLYSDNKIVDAFDGSMGVSRPLTAVNQQAQADAVVNGIISTATSTAKTIGTAGTAMVGGSALSSAKTGAKALSAGGEIVSAGNDFGGGVQGTILQAYNTLQSAIDQPMTNRGGFAGILGQFGNMSPYFIFAWQKNSKPANEIETVGLPSNAGGAVGNFGGFLQCSAFNLANGFTGTDNEANEIYSIMSSGVYVS